jgi:hypothetical protein
MPEQAHSKLFTSPAVLVKKVHIIASSTERKGLLVPTYLRLGAFRALAVAERVICWWRTVTRSRYDSLLS